MRDCSGSAEGKEIGDKAAGKEVVAHGTARTAWGEGTGAALKEQLEAEEPLDPPEGKNEKINNR